MCTFGKWIKKAKNLVNSANISLEEMYFERAALYAEFGKIFVVGMGFLFVNKQGELSLKVKTIANADEKELLVEFIDIINKTYKARELTLVAHNGKEFDFPYLCRRMLIHGIGLPEPLQIAGKKPWEVRHLDTMELWKFGDYKHYTSLKLLTSILGIPSPKDDISGSEVGAVFYKEKNIQRIVIYCEKDTIAIAQLLLRFNNEPLIEDLNIVHV